MNNQGRIKQRRRNGFTIVPNEMLRDSSLSAKAKGILALLLSLPDNFVIYKTSLHSFFSDGRDSVISGWNELESKGYIHASQVRDGGQFVGWEYEISDFPITVEPITENPFSDNTELYKTVSKKTVSKNTRENNNANIEFPDDRWRDLWSSWKAYRREEHRKTYKSLKTEQMALNHLSKIAMGDYDNALQIVKQSMENAWQGLFPLKTQSNGKVAQAQQQLADILQRRRAAGIS